MIYACYRINGKFLLTIAAKIFLENKKVDMPSQDIANHSAFSKQPKRPPQEILSLITSVSS